jgi:hypothetical protein
MVELRDDLRGDDDPFLADQLASGPFRNYGTGGEPIYKP